jgi:hypothetical protein
MTLTRKPDSLGAAFYAREEAERAGLPWTLVGLHLDGQRIHLTLTAGERTVLARLSPAETFRLAFDAYRLANRAAPAQAEPAPLDTAPSELEQASRAPGFYPRARPPAPLDPYGPAVHRGLGEWRR